MHNCTPLNNTRTRNYIWKNKNAEIFYAIDSFVGWKQANYIGWLQKRHYSSLLLAFINVTLFDVRAKIRFSQLPICRCEFSLVLSTHKYVSLSLEPLECEQSTYRFWFSLLIQFVGDAFLAYLVVCVRRVFCGFSNDRYESAFSRW